MQDSFAIAIYIFIYITTYNTILTLQFKTITIQAHNITIITQSIVISSYDSQ